MVNEDTKEEALFRGRYATELRKKKQQDDNSYRGDVELDDEKRSVNQQEMKTPGRRGEKIKQEELDREFSRRSMIKGKKELNQGKETAGDSPMDESQTNK
jgi:hypothetical protein